MCKCADKFSKKVYALKSIALKDGIIRRHLKVQISALHKPAIIAAGWQPCFLNKDEKNVWWFWNPQQEGCSEGSTSAEQLFKMQPYLRQGFEITALSTFPSRIVKPSNHMAMSICQEILPRCLPQDSLRSSVVQRAALAVDTGDLSAILGSAPDSLCDLREASLCLCCSPILVLLRLQ